jgi:hypothetical protein
VGKATFPLPACYRQFFSDAHLCFLREDKKENKKKPFTNSKTSGHLGRLLSKRKVEGIGP